MNKRKFFITTKTILLTLILLTGTILHQDNQRTAHAGFISDIYNNFQQFTEIPDEIDELKGSYQKTLEDLERARLDMEMYQKQNAELAEQNRQLTTMVEQLREEEAKRSRQTERIKTIAITSVALLAGYFLFIRMLRFWMRRHANRS